MKKAGKTRAGISGAGFLQHLFGAGGENIDTRVQAKQSFDKNIKLTVIEFSKYKKIK